MRYKLTRMGKRRKSFDDFDDDSDREPDWRSATRSSERWRQPTKEERRRNAPSSRDDYDYLSSPVKKKKQVSLFGIIWFIVSLPFRIIFQFTRNLKWFLVIPLRIFLSFAFVGLVAGGLLIFCYGSLANRYDISEVLKMPERTIVLDRKNREIGRLHGENRKRVKLDEIPPIFIQALVLREDNRFFTHGGVDWIGVGRAVAQVVKHKRATQGASTLTMQLAKTTFNHQKRDLNTKLVEVALAQRIEASYSKNEILEAYINRIFWGHTFMGLSSAARGYFNKEPAQLSISECAMLAGIIWGPNEFSPYKNPDKAKHARDVVLRLLVENGKISRDDYQTALREPIKTKKPQSRSEENYAMDIIRRELDSILEDENIRLGGLVVHTTLDLDLQNATIDALNKHLSAIESLKGYKHPTRKSYMAMPEAKREKTIPDYLQGACAVIDNSSGALLVLVGGRDGEESRFNRSIQSRRQVGSLFKPFVYTSFFEKGYSPSTEVSDNPIRPGEIPGAPNWSPGNSDNTFRGMQPASFGLVKSRNTMSVRIGHMAGLKNVVQRAALAGFPGRVTMTPALYLGTWEASPLDVASAYTVFANGGVRPTPYIIETIGDSDNQTLFFSRKTTRRAFSQRSANITSSLLQQVTKAGGTAGRLSSLGFKAPCGGKTGTTNRYMNAWFAGFCQSVSASVWVGFDRQRPIMDKGYGATLALPIWADIMKAVQKEGYPCGAIRKSPAGYGKVIWICRESGQIAHTGCEAAHTAYYETMPDVNQPQKMCEKHIPLATPVGGRGSEENIPTAEPLDEPAPSGNDNIPFAEPVDENDDIPLAEPV